MNPSSVNETPNAGDVGRVQRTGGSDWVSFEEEDSQRSGAVNEEGSNVSDTTARKDTSKLNDSRDSSEEKKNDPENPQIPSKRSKKSERMDISKDKNSVVDSGAPAVILTETVHVNLDRSLNRMAAGTESPGGATSGRAANMQTLSTVDLASANGASGRETAATNSGGSNLVGTGITSGISVGSSIREGFVNGDIIVTLLPVNTKWPWITPAQFRPELVPEELMAQGLTLTVEDYVGAMETLTNDVRFHAYNACYKRVLVAWICAAFAVLLALLFSGITGITLFGLGILWLLLNAAAIFLCMWLKIKRKLQEVIASEERDGEGSSGRQEDEQQRQQQRDFQVRMDIEDHDIIIQGSRTTRISRKQVRAEMLLLRYSQRWAKAYLRHQLDLKAGNPQKQEEPSGGSGVNPLHTAAISSPSPPPSQPSSSSSSFPPIPPRHCLLARCPCQFVEEHLRYKPPRAACAICDLMRDPHFMLQ